MNKLLNKKDESFRSGHPLLGIDLKALVIKIHVEHRIYWI